MRLWHYKLIPFLPNSQLIAQWRELNSIYKKQDKHILINYVYEYPKEELYIYSRLVLEEMKSRGIEIRNFQNYLNYFKEQIDNTCPYFEPFYGHHTNRYMLQCFYNLQEKYDRGQKDFSAKQYRLLEDFVKRESSL